MEGERVEQMQESSNAVSKMQKRKEVKIPNEFIRNVWRSVSEENSYCC